MASLRHDCGGPRHVHHNQTGRFGSFSDRGFKHFGVDVLLSPFLPITLINSSVVV